MAWPLCLVLDCGGCCRWNRPRQHSSRREMLRHPLRNSPVSLPTRRLRRASPRLPRHRRPVIRQNLKLRNSPVSLPARRLPRASPRLPRHRRLVIHQSLTLRKAMPQAKLRQHQHQRQHPHRCPRANVAIQAMQIVRADRLVHHPRFRPHRRAACPPNLLKNSLRQQRGPSLKQAVRKRAELKMVNAEKAMHLMSRHQRPFLLRLSELWTL